MADLNTKIITPPDSIDLISLDALKTMLQIPASDTSNDAQLQMLITQNSAVIANKAHRCFGKRTVVEQWRCVGPLCCPDGAVRVWLETYPVKYEDIISVETPPGIVLDPEDWDLDEATGKLTVEAGWYSEKLIVTYTGGYELPDESPPDLQQAAGLMVRSFRTEAAKESTVGSGVRMLAHKDSRVMYYSPKDLAGGGVTSGGTSFTAASQALDNILLPYTRIYC